ncbi:amino acid permease [Mesorhizobium sp. SEMIA 3007]|uniref:Amino acid permease n=1 Tax=Mesorhizobium jarvisii TaxID=1777867 RepID=A0A6M7TEA3_9HYPH|nr:MULTISPECIES: amino acid permease [Mesorhizobium]AID32381.2 amino acid permease [Mesorhizobium huakuii 7653R]ANN56991.1 amino acid permease [Mesorhizobium loti NZP2037]MCH4555152.1 amino acid permease [Mesorhizobium jarvisii]OBQ76082.1 amino acid permease [Mesorhizobium loti]ODA97063.1 amino acid permease [Mesorhizobium sp. SEMIA 3007]
MAAPGYTDVDKAEDVKHLHSMGYAQELERRLSRFSNFAVSFSIICILSGGINSLAQGTSGAGGIGIGIGWLVGCFVSLTFAVAMSQISSAYPTAGGLYHWGSILGNRGTGWVTAWLNLLGLITVLGAINVGTWTFFVGAFGPALGIEGTLTNQMIFLVVVTGLQALINHLGIKLTAKLTDFSGYLIFFGAILIAVVCLISAEHWDFSRLFTFHNYSGDAGGGVWPSVSNAWVFALGLLLPIYTITGYDASAHTSEETIKAASSVPRAMVMSVVWSALFGYLFLVAFVLMIPNMDDAAKQGWNVFFWAFDQRVSPGVKEFVYLVVFVSQLLCGLATVTSASRMIFAFSRDGGLPGSAALAKVSPTYRTPVAAIWTASILSVLFVWGSTLVSVAGTSAYTIVVSCTVIFLFLSFTVPIVLGMLAWGTPKWDKMGPWNMGRGVFMLFAFLSIVSMILIFVIGIQPPNDWALYITVGFFILTAIVWFGFERNRFQGPPLGDIIAARQAAIKAAEQAVGETGH